MKSMLEITNVRRSFGRTKALDGLSLSIPEKSVAAFVGANGAGKTTTFSLVGRFIRPHGGQISVKGLSLKEYFRKGGRIGLLPQDMQFFEDRTIYRQLFLFSQLAGMSAQEARMEVGRVLELTELKDKIHSKPRELSRGMHVRLGIAQALLASPELILLDEPTAGLDPKMIRMFRSVVDSLRGKATLVISSHDLSELEQMCDYVCMIEKGKLVSQGGMQDTLTSSSRVVYQLGASVNMNLLSTKLDPGFELSLSETNQLLVVYDSSTHTIEDVNQLVLAALMGLKVGILSVHPGRSLEEAFLEVTS